MIKLKKLLEISYTRLYSKTPQRYRDRSRDIKVKLKTVGRNGIYYYQTTTISNNHVYNQWIKPRPKKFKINGLNDDVIVHCNCADFQYENEWLLWKNNSSNIVTSNGQPLKIKNPEKLTKLCKHLVAVLNDFKRKVGR